MNKKLIALTASALLLALPFSARAEAPVPSLTVSGAGSVSAPADTATLYVIVETADPEAARAASQNAAVSQSVWNAVLAAGAEDTGITTSGYNLWPETAGQGKKAVRSYHVQNSMKVTVKDLSRTGAISDAAIKAGATRIGQVSFSLSNEAAYREQAVTRAIEDARQKARAIAEGLGCSVSGIQSVTLGDVRTSAPQLRVMNAAMDAASGGAPSTELTPGQQEITGDVTIVFTISQ